MDYGDVADELHKLRKHRQDFLIQNTQKDGKRQRIEEMSVFLEKQVNVGHEGAVDSEAYGESYIVG